ncbi:MAG: hypothetical protein IPJ77_08880 [Planctomycetes bacterium]|nr:hypothetical protein [Planctomycetota bacterium]
MATAAPSPSSSERPAGPRTWRVLLAVAGLATIAFIVFSVLRDPRAAEARPGPFGVECFAPKGTVARFGEFRARGAKPPGGWFRFECFDATKPADAPPVLVNDHRLETNWTPTQAELLTLPERVRWRISAVSADGVVLDSKECEATRAQ